MRKALATIVTVLLALLSSAVQAEVVRDLYSAQVPVADRSQAELNRASGDALSQVLVKVSGSLEVLDNPAIQQALGKSRGYVQQYAYARANTPGLMARFEFDDSVIADLLSEAGAPLWTANRPVVLVWIVVETASGRFLLNNDSDPMLVEEVTRQFSQRGVPVRLPLFDLVDAASMPPEAVWRQDSDTLKAGSARYGLEDVLAGRVAALSTGTWVGDWVYLSSETRLDRSYSTGTAEEFIREGVAMVAQDMASRFAVAPTNAVGPGVLMTVSGISTYADYAGVVAWLESLELIEHANIERISGDRIELRLVAQADASQLASIIELNEQLQPAEQIAPGTGLDYQWQN